MTEQTAYMRVPESLVYARLRSIADGLVVAIAVSLPWSTTATSVLIVLWLLALAPTIGFSEVRRELLTWTGGLPVLLWMIAVAGMLWSEASFRERLAGQFDFLRLITIPVLLAQFRRSDGGKRVLIGFLCSALALLVASTAHVALVDRIPLISRLPGIKGLPGVPVKDYISQNTAFVICIFSLLGVGISGWRQSRRQYALGCVLLAILFLANIAYVASARVAVVDILVLASIFGVQNLNWRSWAPALICGGTLILVLWQSSPYLRGRVSSAFLEGRSYEAGDPISSVGLRLDYLARSLSFVAQKPIVGHGTGSIAGLFKQSVLREGGAPAQATTNPHQQIFAVAIQLGLIGTVLLLAMWAVHIALFSGGGLTSWIGLVVVVENVVSSQFNSHLFDFTQGWLYIFGVGVIGGMVRKVQLPQALSA